MAGEEIFIKIWGGFALSRLPFQDTLST